MCAIGDFVEMRDVPKDKPLRGHRFWFRHDGDLWPLRARRSMWRRNLRPWRVGGVKRAHERPVAWADRDPNHAGLWAHRRASDLKRLRRDFPPPRYASGVVLLWGRVAVHTDGYRAQYATIAQVRHAR